MRSEHLKTQEEVARAVGLSRPQYTAIELGRSMPSFDTLCSIARVYHVSLSSFFSGVC